MKLLAPDYTVLARSADPENVFVGSPALAELPSGRIIGTYEWFRGGPSKEKIPDQCETIFSDDDGCTWVAGGKTDLMWASPFVKGGALYKIGNLRGSRDIAPSVVESFSYTSQLIHGDGLLIAARTSLGGKNQHDTNLVTLHRVKHFRALVPEGF